MKKKRTVLLITLCAVVIATAYFLIPAPMLPDYDKVEIYRVILVTNSFDCRGNIDITEQIDRDKMISALEKSSRSKLLRLITGHEIFEGDIEVSLLLDDEKDFNIYLSAKNNNLNFIYGSTLGHNIRNSGELYKEIAMLLPAE
ncbi:MAG: hypothetical protein AB7D36_09675 [Oscillospiraceae bacterium]